MQTTTNRTYWPVSGGAISFQPGWFQGHATAQIFINLGFGTDGPDGGPPNMSNSMIPQFGIIGPSKNPYPGTICLPQVPLPVNATVKPGDNATIQVVELAVHGAALYSVSRPSLPAVWSVQMPVRAESLPLLGTPVPSLVAELGPLTCPPTVRRHYVCRGQRPASCQGQRDQLLQQLRHWFH